MRHDPEQYVYNNYNSCENHITSGASFENTNMPPGYRYKPWAVQELMETSDRHEPIVDEGDWS